MKQHSFRWPGLVFGLMFVFFAMAWWVWSTDAVDATQFGYLLAGTLIVGGVGGIAATFWPDKPVDEESS